jgi:hypothetical protein
VIENAKAELDRRVPEIVAWSRERNCRVMIDEPQNVEVREGETRLMCLNPFAKAKIVESPVMQVVERVQYRFPRSRKKRIVLKWRKDAQNFRNVEVGGTLKFADVLYVHPFLATQMLLKMKKQIEDEILREMMGCKDGEAGAWLAGAC